MLRSEFSWFKDVIAILFTYVAKARERGGCVCFIWQILAGVFYSSKRPMICVVNTKWNERGRPWAMAVALPSWRVCSIDSRDDKDT
jgi:hypothetical protein